MNDGYAERARKGDEVLVTMTRNNIFPWQTSPSFRAILLGYPQGAGDTFQLDVDGCHLNLNGNSADFVAIVRESP